MRRWLASALVLLAALLVTRFSVDAQKNGSALESRIAQGQAAFDRDDYTGALLVWGELLDQIRGAGNKQHTRHLVYEMGYANFCLGNFVVALGQDRQALAIDTELGNRLNEADDLVRISDVEDALGRTTDAMTSAQKALAIARDLRQLHAESNARSAVGRVAEDLGLYADALREQQEALTLDLRLKNLSYEAADLGSIGVLFEDMGRYADALSELQKALALAVQLKDLRMEAGDRTNLGNVEVFLGRYDDALGSQERAYAIDHALKFQVAEAEDDGNLGVIQMDLGRYPEALAFHQRALGIVTSRGDLRDESLALANIGSVEEYMERYSDALASLTKAMDIARKIENPRIAVQLFTQIGELEPALGNPTAGANDVLQALTLAKDIKDNADEANLLSSFGRLQSLEGDYSDALRTAKQAEDLDRELGDPEALWSSLQAVASAEAGLDQRVAAVADYGAAIDQLEQIRGGLKPTERASYIASRMAIYGAFIEYLRELDARYPNGGYGRKALDVFEREAGRSELEQLGASAAQHFFGVPPGVVEHEAVLETAVEDAQTSSTKVMSVASPDPASIAMVKATLTNAESAQRTFEAVVERRYSKYYTLRHPQPLDVNAFQSALRPGQILLTYDVSHHIAWVVTHDQFVFVPKLPSEPVIEKAVKALRDHVATLVSSGNRPNSVKETSAFARDSYTLYRMLMPEPVAAMMKGPGKSLIVVPSGALRQVPFAALVTQDPAVDPTHPHYLIEDIPISYASSGSLFVTVKEAYAHHRAAPQTLIAFANPTFPATGAFKPLPGSLTEANDTLASLEPAIEPASGAIVSGDDASLQRVRAMNKSKSNSLATYRYVLFATHAVLPDAISDVPPPAIVLAHPERGIDKSFLTMADVFNLSFNADFIMLSACKTGVGNAQGISGLTRSFLYAGTPAVAVTLWDVDQPAGPALTPTFFAGMRAGETSAQALKDAQVAMINSGDLTESHPYEWAPFVIYGDGDLATRT